MACSVGFLIEHRTTQLKHGLIHNGLGHPQSITNEENALQLDLFFFFWIHCRILSDFLPENFEASLIYRGSSGQSGLHRETLLGVQGRKILSVYSQEKVLPFESTSKADL